MPMLTDTQKPESRFTWEGSAAQGIDEIMEAFSVSRHNVQFSASQN